MLPPARSRRSPRPRAGRGSGGCRGGASSLLLLSFLNLPEKPLFLVLEYVEVREFIPRQGYSKGPHAVWLDEQPRDHLWIVKYPLEWDVSPVSHPLCHPLLVASLHLRLRLCFNCRGHAISIRLQELKRKIRIVLRPALGCLAFDTLRGFVHHAVLECISLEIQGRVKCSRNVLAAEF